MENYVFEIPPPAFQFINSYHLNIDVNMFPPAPFPRIPEKILPDGLPHVICNFSISDNKKAFLIMYMQLALGVHQGELYQLWLLKNDPRIYLEKYEAATFDLIESSRALTTMECNPPMQLEINFLQRQIERSYQAQAIQPIRSNFHTIHKQLQIKNSGRSRKP